MQQSVMKCVPLPLYHSHICTTGIAFQVDILKEGAHAEFLIRGASLVIVTV